MEKIWIIGDDFVANTFDQYVKNAVRKTELYMKRSYDISCFAKKSHESNIRNVIARVKFQLVKALDTECLLPKSILVILDDDIIRRVEAKCDEDNLENMSTIFSCVMKHLINQFRKLIESRKDQLPEKSISKIYPTIYWVESPQHCNFNNNLSRRKMNSAIQAECSILDNSKIMRMKKVWNSDDEHAYLASHSRFTSDGIFKYWGSIDNALEFNDNKNAAVFMKADQRMFQNQQYGRNKYKWTKAGQTKFKRREEDREYNEQHRFRLPEPKSLNY